MAVQSKSAELYLSKRLPETTPKYSTFYSSQSSAIHKGDVTLAGQSPKKPKKTKKGDP